MKNDHDCLPRIDLVIRMRGGCFQIVVRGDVDAATVGSLALALDVAEEVPELVVDLTATTFIDLGGIRALARCARHRRRRGRSLLIVGPPPSGESILRMAPFSRDLHWEPRTDRSSKPAPR